MDRITELAAQVGAALKAEGLLLTTAESCTGGGIAHAVTEIAGSSEWFDRGFVTYSNAAKTEMLKVPETLLVRFGAVSEETAAAMAEGAVSVTGIAGPGGAVPGKPVGTVCFGWSYRGKTSTQRLVFAGDRHSVREQSVAHSLQVLLRHLEEA